VLRVFALFLALTFMSYAIGLCQPGQNLSEEQDYAFCYGLFKDGKYPLAMQELSRVLEKYPQSSKQPDAMYMSADCLFQLKQTDLSLLRFAAFCKAFPASSLRDDALFRMGEICFQRGDYAKSIQHFTAVIAGYPKEQLAGESAYWIGESKFKSGDTAGALRYYQLCYTQYPECTLADYAAYSEGWALEKNGDVRKAIERYKEFRTRFPKSELVATASVRLGSCYIHLQQYQQAVDLLMKARAEISSEDDIGEIDYLIGEAYLATGDHLRALKQYERFLTMHKGHRLERDVRYSLGWTYLKEDNYAKAADIFGALATGSDDIAQAALFRKGVALNLKGRTAEALRAFSGVVSRWPRGAYADDALYQSGLVHFDRKEFTNAAEAFNRLIRAYPDGDRIGEAYWMAGETHLTGGDYPAARDAFHRAVSAKGVPDDVAGNALFQEGWTLEKLKEYAKASSVFSSFVQQYPHHKRLDQAYFWLGESFFLQDNMERALAYYSKVVTDFPASSRYVDALYGKAWSLFRLERYAGAAQGFETLTKTPHPGAIGFDAQLRLGDSYYALKEYTKAGAAYAAAIQKYPSTKGVDYAYYQAAQTSMKNGSPEKGIARYKELLQKFPGSSYADDARYGIGWVYFQLKRYDDAIREFEKVEGEFKGSDLVPKSLYSVGDCYYNAKKYQQAAQAYRTVLDRFPSSPYVSDALNGLQYCYRLLGKDEQAIAIIDEFVRKNRGNGMADRLMLKKAEVFYGREEYQKAVNAYDAFLKAFPQSDGVPQAHYWKGKSLAELGAGTEALAEFSNVISRYPKSAIAADALLETGHLQQAQKNFAAALGTFDRLEREYSDLAVQAGYEKGLVYREMGEPDKAMGQLQSVADRNPATLWGDRSLVSIGEILQSKHDYDAALALFNTIAARRTDEIGAEAQFRIGETLFDQGRYKEAVPALLRVKYVYPESHEWIARAYLAMGMSYEKTQERGKAREAYQSVLKSHKEDQFGREADKRLGELQ
jgi:TolA-binding protein